MPDDFDSGWDRIGPRLAAIVESAQYGAALDGEAFVSSALSQQGQRVAPEARAVPAALAGRAADGRTLQGLLYGAVTHARGAAADSLTARLAIGQAHLDGLVHTAVVDAGRDAAKVSMVARPRVKWVRLTSAPCCGRCAVLSGRVYAHSEAFKRHPRCDCSMLPRTVANPEPTSFGPGDVTDLTSRQRELIAAGDGSDWHFNKVINDYQRKRGDFLPPTRVDRLAARRSQREAAEALRTAGYLAA